MAGVVGGRVRHITESRMLPDDSRIWSPAASVLPPVVALSRRPGGQCTAFIGTLELLLMQRFARHSAAILLATIYSVVGGMGESLFYLAEAAPTQPLVSGQEHDGYFHQHGDGLWHHHGSSLGAKAPEAVFTANAPDDHTAESVDGTGHLDHSCCLLALIAQMQQSGASTPEAFFSGDSGGRFVGAPDRRAPSVTLSRLGARGPPRLALV